MPQHLMAKLFTLRGIKMSKIVIDMGYRSLVMDADVAVKVMDLLGKAELYSEKYHSAVGDTPSHSTFHVYPMDAKHAAISMRLLGDEAYKMYKLAGAPEN